MYGKAAFAYNQFYETSQVGPMSFNVMTGMREGAVLLDFLIESAMADIGRLEFTLDGFVSDQDILRKAETRNSMVTELRQSYLKVLLLLGWKMEMLTHLQAQSLDKVIGKIFHHFKVY